MKVSKNIKLKLFVLIVFLLLMFVQIGPYLLYADENELTFSYRRIELVATNEYYNSNNLFFSEAYVGQNLAYCIDYGVPLPVSSGGTVRYIRTLSGITTSALVHGYPNVSAASLGVNSDEEAMLATQFAVWRLATATGDSQKTNRIFDMVNLQPTVGHEEYIARVKAAAQRIIDRAKVDPYYANPQLHIEDNAKIVVDGDTILVGPYKINGTGFNITSVNVSLQNQPKSALLCDVNRNAKNTFSNGEDIYVKMNTSDASTSFTLTVNEKGNHSVAKVYGTGVAGDAKQDYAFLTTYPDDLTNNIVINIPELKGSIKVIKHDQYNKPLQGVKFELRDTKGTVLQTKETDASGTINFTDLKIGKYVIQEKGPLEGYILMDVPIEIEVKYNTVKEIEVENKKIEGGLKIIKKDEDNEKPIQGVTFQILDSNKKVIDTIKTNSEGIAISNKLPVGTYYFKEVSAPSNIMVDSTEREFKITDPNVTIVKTVLNYYTRGTLTVIKTNEDKQPIEGVVFKIFDSNKNEIQTLTTDANGKITTKKLKHGDYYFMEVSAPESAHVVVNSTMIPFHMDYSDREVPFENKYAKGNLKVIKTGDDGRVLKDVVFNILDENKNVVDTITTDEKGIAISKKLVLGTYYYKEIDAPENVIKDENEYEFKLTQDAQIITKEIENELIKTGKLKVEKVDILKRPIQDVVFEILDKDKKVVDTITTDEKGIAVSKELVLGEYFYREVSAPKGVIIDKTEYKFKLTQNAQIITKKIENDLDKGSLTIYKVDENGKYLENITFTLLNEEGIEIDKKTTGKDGIAKFTDLLPGKYSFKEVDAPVNVVKNETPQPIEITVDKLNVEVTVENKYAKGTLQIVKTDEKDQKVEGVKFEILDEKKNVIDTIVTDKKGIAISKQLTLGKYFYREVEGPDYIEIDKNEYEFKVTKNDQIITKEIENELKRGSLSIFKVDEDGNYLENVTFTLINDKGEEIDKKTTGKDGIVKFTDLLPGKYNFKEVEAPINVVADEELKPIEITVDKLNVEVTVENEFARGMLRIIKTDMADNLLKGVTFEILDSEKNVIETLTTDENGVIETQKLLIGKYYFREVSAEDENIIIDTKIHEFKIAENDQVVTAEIKNKTVDGVVIITKVDSENKDKVLAGAEIQILDENKNVIKTLTTNEEGQVKLGNLKVGKYYYKETKAPEGYILDSNEHEFTITRESQEVKITFKNEAKKLPQTGGFLSTNALIVIIVAAVSTVGYVIISVIRKAKESKDN